MCLCLYIPEGGKISVDRLRDAYTANPDGCGVLWKNKGRLICHKGNYSFEDWFIFYHKAVAPVLVHFRTASSGAISHSAAHPLFVNDNLAFVMNGNIPEYTDGESGLTDIQRFNELFLKNLPPDFLDQPDIRNALEKYCENRMIKMAFMDNEGKVNLINEQAGEWVDGCWYSNAGVDGYKNYGFSGTYPLKEGEIRHFGGLQSVMTFDEKERKKWNQCQTCLGWFPKADIKKYDCFGCAEWKALVELTK